MSLQTHMLLFPPWSTQVEQEFIVTMAAKL